MVDFFCLTEKKIHAFIDKKTYCSDRILNTVLASIMGGWRVLILVINHVISIFFEVIIWRNILEIISNRVYLLTALKSLTRRKVTLITKSFIRPILIYRKGILGCWARHDAVHTV